MQWIMGHPDDPRHAPSGCPGSEIREELGPARRDPSQRLKSLDDLDGLSMGTAGNPGDDPFRRMAGCNRGGWWGVPAFPVGRALWPLFTRSGAPSLRSRSGGPPLPESRPEDLPNVQAASSIDSNGHSSLAAGSPGWPGDSALVSGGGEAKRIA